MCLASSQLCSVWCRNCRKSVICMDTSQPEVRMQPGCVFGILCNGVSNLPFYRRRYQCSVTVSRTIQLHIDDALQLLLWLFAALVHGIPRALDPGIHFDFAGAQIPATIESEDLHNFGRLHFCRFAVWLPNSSEIFAGTSGRKWTFSSIGGWTLHLIWLNLNLFTAILHTNRSHQQNHSIVWDPPQ